MNNRWAVCAILVITMAMTGCAKNSKPTAGLDVDLYIHPTSADPTDIILQTAISKRLNDSAITRIGLIHVRVEDKTVILTGTATAEVRKEAERIASQTELTLNGESIRPREPVTNRITTK